MDLKSRPVQASVTGYGGCLTCALFWPQVYVHPTDPEFAGYRVGSVFHGAEIANRVHSTAYLSYDLVEATRSMLAAALQGEASMCI